MKPRILNTIKIPRVKAEWSRIEERLASAPPDAQYRGIVQWVTGTIGTFRREYETSYGKMADGEEFHTVKWLVEELNEGL